MKKVMKVAKKKVIAVSKTRATSALALEHNSGVRSEVQTSREEYDLKSEIFHQAPDGRPKE
jgi:hypothetical protein